MALLARGTGGTKWHTDAILPLRALDIPGRRSPCGKLLRDPIQWRDADLVDSTDRCSSCTGKNPRNQRRTS